MFIKLKYRKGSSILEINSESVNNQYGGHGTNQVFSKVQI
jgi:hypothetical protein